MLSVVLSVHGRYSQVQLQVEDHRSFVLNHKTHIVILTLTGIQMMVRVRLSKREQGVRVAADEVAVVGLFLLYRTVLELFWNPPAMPSTTACLTWVSRHISHPKPTQF